jgi:hypothetical protein
MFSLKTEVIQGRVLLSADGGGQEQRRDHGVRRDQHLREGGFKPNWAPEHGRHGATLANLQSAYSADEKSQQKTSNSQH